MLAGVKDDDDDEVRRSRRGKGWTTEWLYESDSGLALESNIASKGLQESEKLSGCLRGVVAHWRLQNRANLPTRSLVQCAPRAHG